MLSDDCFFITFFDGFPDGFLGISLETITSFSSKAFSDEFASRGDDYYIQKGKLTYKWQSWSQNCKENGTQPATHVFKQTETK